MRVLSAERLGQVLSALPGTPRVVAGGNFATPWQALAVLDVAVAEYRLFMLNAQVGVPDRDGVTLKTPFVGPGMRGRDRLRYGTVRFVPSAPRTFEPELTRHERGHCLARTRQAFLPLPDAIPTHENYWM